MKIKSDEISYWAWLFRDSGKGRPITKSYCNKWLIVHIIIAILLTKFLEVDHVSAISLSVPFMGVLIAITVAWCGNIISLLNTKEITNFSKYYHGGIRGYAFTIQSAILILFLTIISWALYGFKLFSYAFIPFLFSSIAIRDCWHVILFTQLLTIIRAEIILENDEKQQKENSTIPANPSPES